MREKECVIRKGLQKYRNVVNGKETYLRVGKAENMKGDTLMRGKIKRRGNVY